MFLNELTFAFRNRNGLEELYVQRAHADWLKVGETPKICIHEVDVWNGGFRVPVVEAVHEDSSSRYEFVSSHDLKGGCGQYFSCAFPRNFKEAGEFEP